ncbi:5'/3'-nucleotidase SurE [Rhodoligotrophos appendicifer]|uniref:5'/3'-nucleotidase SurE n=1 Tax=Rhodoligotrophos appendicifer TaxID=987056 RepID=UPI0011856C27|nr:5'/3'-nucleotidase SurE [Rhodoligotrophos appendicifer]
MRILVTNDDGIYGPGLEVLEAIANELSSDVWVVAPQAEESGASHSLTLAEPLRLRQYTERRFAVKGTPTDCVVMALKKVMPEPPHLVLSGVNRGQNLADDVTYSGTIAAAMEGTALGVMSFALSQSYGFQKREKGEKPVIHWETAKRHGADVVRRLYGLPLGAGTLLNINFPDCPPERVTGVEITTQGKRDQNLLLVDERIDARGNPYFWLGFKREMSNPASGTDLRAIMDEAISVTPLHLNLTQIEVMDTLREALAKSA